jgi:glycosyltransferase involved in cell wall biosynthesis
MPYDKDGHLNILAYVDTYSYKQGSEAESALHELLLELRKIGHKITVVAINTEPKEMDGIRITNAPRRVMPELIKNYDVLFTHLALSEYASKVGRVAGKVVVQIVHNVKSLRDRHVVSRVSDIIILNSENLKKQYTGRSEVIVVNPPSPRDRYKTKPGHAITLFNLSYTKGADIFWKLAELMPDQEFIGVLGQRGKQIVNSLPNVTIYPANSDSKDIYSRTKVLLMPSRAESWGKNAIEAAHSGIPTVCSAAEGIEEATAGFGLVVETGDVLDYKNAIERILDPEIYKKYSESAKKRAGFLDGFFKFQLKTLEEKLLELSD